MRSWREMGIKVSLWQLPYIPEGSQLFDDLKAVGGFVKTAEGEIYDVGICMVTGFEGVVGCVDYTNPEARRVHQDYLRRLFALGARVIKVDFGEKAPLDGVYHDGTPGHRAHNLYPLLYNRAIAEVTREATGERIIWARSAWAGSQRYPLHWGGDSSANWSNLIPQIEGGLSFGLSGFQFWSQDIGGFLGTTGGPLLVRWMQAGMFLSHAASTASATASCTRSSRGAADLPRLHPAALPAASIHVRLGDRLRRAMPADGARAGARVSGRPERLEHRRPVAPGRRASGGADLRREWRSRGVPARRRLDRLVDRDRLDGAAGSTSRPISRRFRSTSARGPSFRWVRS